MVPEKPVPVPQPLHEIRVRGRTLVLPPSQDPASFQGEGVFVLDFERKFDDPDLSKFPARAVPIRSKQERYLVSKYNVILGEFSDL